jgi:hypothetical protein
MMYLTMSWVSIVVLAIMGVIMIVRLHTMYQQSRRLLNFLILVFLVVTITDGVTFAIAMKGIVVGTHSLRHLNALVIWREIPYFFFP